jgi:hypothetical protein
VIEDSIVLLLRRDRLVWIEAAVDGGPADATGTPIPAALERADLIAVALPVGAGETVERSSAATDVS